MNIFSTLPGQVTAKLLAQLGGDYNTSEANQADIVILIRKSQSSGVETPVPYIKNPQAAVVIAGTPDWAGEKFAEEAISAGVPDTGIFIIPKGQSLSLNLLAKKIIEIADTIKQPATNESNDWVPQFEEGVQEKPGPNQVRRIARTIAILSCKGGIGRTTIAASLLAHYQDIGERACLLDLSWPSTAGYHIGVNRYQERDGFLFQHTQYGNLVRPKKPYWKLGTSVITEQIHVLLREYQRLLLDLPTYPPAEFIKAIQADKTVVLVDYDITQVVEPTATKVTDRLNHIFVYNRAIPEVEQEVVLAYLDSARVQIVKPDIDGCIAALAAGQPASRSSAEIAKVIGTLAAIIDSEEG